LHSTLNHGLTSTLRAESAIVCIDLDKSVFDPNNQTLSEANSAKN